jgi:SpoVK/Ycf46/Vps4 family AAA+-type ATPase
MARKSYQPEKDENLLLDLVRLGMAGDSASVRALARQLLARKRSTYSAQFNKNLGHLLLEGPESALRSVAAQQLPVEEESAMPLLDVEVVASATEPILDRAAAEALAQVVAGRQSALALIEAGVEPPRTVLLTGAPGVGKTMSARYLAAELALPLATVELSTLMSSFLGKTGQNLRRILDHAKTNPCVLFLDEFDAVAKSRDDASDTGELKRLVNLLLLELDRWPTSSLLVAATNHPQLLDPAVGRRFDVVIDLAHPGLEERHEILARAVGRIRGGEEVSARLIGACAVAFEGESGSGLESLVSQAARGALLDEQEVGRKLAEVAFGRLKDAPDLKSRKRRAAFAATASEQLGMTQREIAEILGVSHPTVGKLVKEWRVGEMTDAAA